MKLREKTTKFKNPRTGEIWICPDIKQRRQVDGIDFIEVHKPENVRRVWINLNNLERVNTHNK